ncbi:MAG: SsrA-binding protein SmpB [Candidatus Omnitrophota bacterium]
MSETIATNKKAFHNYFLTDKWECGVELKGGEVKSVRAGEVNFKDAYVRVEEGEVWLFNLHIAPYAQASYLNEDPDRKRKLLMNKKEIKRLFGILTQKQLNCVPTRIYITARGLVKVEIALAQGKKLYDKRADIKDRDTKREMARATRSFR